MEDVSVIIDQQRYGFWSDVEVRLPIDSFSTVSFSAPFEPVRAEFRATFRPFTFKPLEVRIGDSVLFNGTMVGVHPNFTANERKVDVTGYALPGVLDDCSAPGKSVPLEFKKVKLRVIAQTLARPFGLSVQFNADDGAPFDKVALEESKKIFEFLTELAQQRNLVLTNTTDGVLLCWKSVEPGNPVASLVEGVPPVTSVSASFSPQEYFSEITGFASAKRGRKGSKYTQKNPHLPGVLRPMSFRLDDTEKGDAPEETRAKLGRMFATVCEVTVEDLPTWRDPSGELWAPNTTIMLEAPSAMVYRPYEFLVRAVTFKQSAEKETATLELVLPGSFSGTIPATLPWQD